MISHKELINLYDKLFDKDVKEGISEFLRQDFDNKGRKYKTDMLWKIDALIGGVGGYCLPSSSLRNPYPAGIERELYRPLQYAKEEIDFGYSRVNARYIIDMCGMHLEAACRLLLMNSILDEFRFSNCTLGKAVHRIDKKKMLDDNIIQALYDFIQIYNRSKHEVNQDETRERLFSTDDAIVVYFATRILGVNILQKLGRVESYKVYDIL
jgi:hypothetical protein